MLISVFDKEPRMIIADTITMVRDNDGNEKRNDYSISLINPETLGPLGDFFLDVV